MQFEFVRQLSEDPNNLVIGLVRDKSATEKKIAAEFGGRTNVHILTGDLANYETLKKAVAETTKIVSDHGIDYLVASGGYLPLFDAFGPIGGLLVFAIRLPNLADDVQSRQGR
jgi:NAD(P)-dependent dehydrogenase (short-subunit alcohol dehydrogenase family)